MARTVSEVMAPVRVRLDPATTLRRAAIALRDGSTGLAVIEEPGAVSVLTERDILRAIAEGVDLDAVTVGERMTGDPATVEPTASLDAACDLMIERGVRHLLVRERGALLGVVNMRDVVSVLSGAAPLGAVPPARGS